MKPINTVCAYCGVGCGLIVDPEGGLQADPDHPANHGRVCAKGATLMQTLNPQKRLLYPMLHRHRVSWSKAINHIAGGFQAVIDRHGPDAVAFYVSGQFLTEDYYVANKLMKGFIGSANIDTNSRLCMASTVVGHTRAFGADTVPGCYEDLDLADLIVIAGANTAACHPVLFQRIMERKQASGAPHVIVIDPRASQTALAADQHIAIRPGADGFLFGGLLHHLNRTACMDLAFLEQHVGGFAAATNAVSALTLPQTAAACGLSTAETAAFFERFARTPRVVTLYSQGINQSSSGSDKVNAILNCHLATGRIGKPGAGPFSLTGQGNAMGGREVGGLANQLAAHLDFQDPGTRAMLADFWQAPKLAPKPGLKAVDLFDAVAAGKVKALWIACTNPAVSMPDSALVRRALAACDLLVVSECMADTETAAFADVLLPAATWGEKSGTVTNSERRISRQRALQAAPGEAKPDWWAFAAVARAMGWHDAFDYHSPAQIFREHAALSGRNNNGRRDFDISALADISDRHYDQLRPIQWPVNAQYPQGRARFFDDGLFFHRDGKAVMVAVNPRLPAQTPDALFPLQLLTGRVPDQWHSMSRTGDLAALRRRDEEPSIAVHPDDAAAAGVGDHPSGLVTVTGHAGEFCARLELTETQRPGTVFAPFHWTSCFAANAKANLAVSAVCDPLSGQPEFKAAPVRLGPLQCGSYGFVFAREDLAAQDPLYWVRIPRPGFVRYEFAVRETLDDGLAWFQSLWPQAKVAGNDGEWLVFRDAGEGGFRAAYLTAGRLAACVFAARRRPLPSRQWIEALFLKDRLALDERKQLLAGAPV